MVLTAYSALSSATNSFCHRHLRIKGLSKPGWADAPPQTWHQQRMPGPHGFAVRISAARLHAGASLTRFSSPCNGHWRARRYRVHRIPYPTSVTIAIRPSCGYETAETSGVDLPDETSEIFFSRGLDRNLQDDPSGKSVPNFAVQKLASKLCRAASYSSAMVQNLSA